MPIDPATALGVLKALNPLRAFAWLRRLIWREPPKPMRCRQCGATDRMRLWSVDVKGGQVVETYNCDACGQPYILLFPKR